MFFAFFSCRNQTAKEIENTGRINRVIGNGNPEIIEVDGHEYLYDYKGGMLHLESCQCKKH